ncbi:MAG: GHKL domain-containing protein [Bacteroidales bacterium]|jgi:nitrogen fixation/metabolism regulation signal transduction histidine kinase|nr:GHKL domain-containing protein [Bacteroidales bacterium]
MFKSIEYNLILYLALLTAAIVAGTYFIMRAEYLEGGLAGIAVCVTYWKLRAHYKKFNTNILFLLNALDNGDYSFHFSETKMSRREQELNRMMNRIRDVLTHARMEVIENEKFLSLVVESASAGIVIFDEHGIVHKVNSAALQLFKRPILTHLRQLRFIDESLPQTIAGMSVGSSIQIAIADEREEKQVSIRMAQVSTAKGVFKIITIYSIGNELDTKEMESWIRLIRVMTHEIMNSIAPISSLSEAMLSSLRQEDSETLRSDTIEAFRTIYDTTGSLLHFVESYRKFTGVPQPQKRPVALQPLLQEIIRLQSSEIEQKGIRIALPKTDILLNADKEQITQALINILKNAIEAFPPDCRNAEINISAQHNNGRICIDVSNNGTPIPKDVAPHIFIPFFTTKASGSGIGLSLSRYIMRLHGGTLKHYTDNRLTIFSMEF